MESRWKKHSTQRGTDELRTSFLVTPLAMGGTEQASAPRRQPSLPKAPGPNFKAQGQPKKRPQQAQKNQRKAQKTDEGWGDSKFARAHRHKSAFASAHGGKTIGFAFQPVKAARVRRAANTNTSVPTVSDLTASKSGPDFKTDQHEHLRQTGRSLR